MTVSRYFWREGLRLGFIVPRWLLACVVLTIWSGQASATNAYLEIDLESPPLPPEISTIAGASWDYYYASGVEHGCGPNNPVASEEALKTCFLNAGASEFCGSGDLIPQGSWETSGVLVMGLVRAENRAYQWVRTGWAGNHPDGPGCHINLSSNITLKRDRILKCNPPHDGYSQGDSACVNQVSRKLRVTPVTCAAGAGDSRRGNPCDASTGDKSQVEVDYQSPELGFTRYYHSFLQLGHAGLGIGWTHTYSTRLVLTGGGTKVPRAILEASGYTQPLTSVATGVYVSITGSGDQVRAGSGNLWTVFRASGGRDTFDSSGRLLERESSSGLVETLNYASDGLLESVEGPFGHSLTFNYDSIRYRIVSIVDFANASISYEYDAAGNLDAVEYPDNSQREYLYEDSSFPNALTGILDETGGRFSTYEYDDKGRVVVSEHAGGVGRITLVYNEVNGTTTVTDAAGTVETFAFTSHSGQWTWRFGVSATYPSLAAALEAAQADCDHCWNLQPKIITSYQPPTAGDADFRKLLSSGIGGQGTSIAYLGDYARRIDSLTDATGKRTKYEYDTFHRTSVTEADQDTSGVFKRTTTTTYLEDTSRLPDTIISPSVAG
ncbi:MAG: hypothetical protein KJZ78_06910, partial [Bryobacteraceae bacterium]|nr:hypothetical protein [Bryobacteraceae bacterium]